ncbi:predicted protein [Postia placenta Mad-698-R]|nr:predicted protein [Postia placenta Mad-698-R]
MIAYGTTPIDLYLVPYVFAGYKPGQARFILSSSVGVKNWRDAKLPLDPGIAHGDLPSPTFESLTPRAEGLQYKLETEPMEKGKESVLSEASSPFDRTDADVILQSSDEVQFRVHRVILALASPVFADMFGLPPPRAPDGTTMEAIQTVYITESSHVLRILLDMCYPVTNVQFSSLDDVHAVLKAAVKYDMSKVIALAYRALSTFISKSAMRVYAIACQLGAEDVAREAAPHAAIQELLPGNYKAEFEGMPAGCLHRLWEHMRTDTKQASYCYPEQLRDQTDTNESLSRVNSATFLLDAPNADLTIVTSDNVQLRVCRQTISLCSPVLKDMLELTTCDSSSTSGGDMSDCGRTAGATLSVPEDSITFVPTLLLSYPTGTPEMNATQLVSLLPTAEKYGMQRAIWFIKRQWPEFARNQQACSINFLFMRTSDEIRSIYVPELETSTAGLYYRLLQYHERRGEIIHGSGPRSWPSLNVKGASCPYCMKNGRPSWMPPWIHEAVVILRQRPSPCTINDVEGQAFQALLSVAMSRCSNCKRNAVSLRKLWMRSGPLYPSCWNKKATGDEETPFGGSVVEYNREESGSYLRAHNEV